MGFDIGSTMSRENMEKLRNYLDDLNFGLSNSAAEVERVLTEAMLVNPIAINLLEDLSKKNKCAEFSL